LSKYFFRPPAFSPKKLKTFQTYELSKIKARVGYLAPDGKASTARIGAVSLPQSAWIVQYEQWCKCFAARCIGILQGRFTPH